MSDPRHEHGSGVVPAGAYAPGSRAMNPAGLSKGVSAVPAEHYPKAKEPEPEEEPRPSRPDRPRPPPPRRGRLKLRENDHGTTDAP